MIDLYIVRHGNTFDKGDVVTRVGARTDLALSRSGRSQAEQLRDHFAATLRDGFALAYCSPLSRTRETAELILEADHQAPDLKTLEFLREVDYGPDENKPEADVVERLGAAAIAAWDEHAVPPPGWVIDPDAIRLSWRALFENLARTDLSAPVLIVTSNGVARFALDAVTDFRAQPGSIKLKTGAYGQLRLFGDEIELTDWNVRP